MSVRTVAEKMGIRPGMRALLVNAPEDAVRALRLPEIVRGSDADGPLDYIHLFTRSEDELDDQFPRLEPLLAPRGHLWVSWPKGRRGTSLTLKEVIRIGYSHGLVESTCLSVNEVWSALKFTRPVPGKVYNNSYGRLPEG